MSLRFDDVRENFFSYLRNRCGLKWTSAQSYLNDVTKVDKILLREGVTNESVFKYKKVHDVYKFMEAAKSNETIRNLDRYNNHIYAIIHFYEFSATDSHFDHVW